MLCTQFALSLIAEPNEDASKIIFHYDQLELRHAFLLLNLPLVATELLTDRILDQSILDKLQKTMESGNDDLEDEFKNACKLLNRLIFTTAPNNPAICNERSSLALFISMTNYLLLFRSLQVVLEEGMPDAVLSKKGGAEFIIDFGDSFDLVDIPHEIFYQILMGYFWIIISLSVIKYYLSEEDVADTSGSVIGVPYYKIIREKNENAEGIIGDFIHIARPNQGDYGLYVLFTKTNNIKFMIKCTKKMSKVEFIEMVFKNLLIIEDELITTISLISDSWKMFIENIDTFILTSPNYMERWIHGLLDNSERLKLSFKDNGLRRALMTLDSEVPTATKLITACDRYKKLFSNYISDELKSIIVQANSEIDLILAQIREKGKGSKSKHAIKYMEKHSKRFTIITSDETSYAIKKQYDGDSTTRNSEGNEARDVREYILQEVIKRNGRNLSKLAIRNLLKSLKS